MVIENGIMTGDFRSPLGGKKIERRRKKEKKE